MFVQVWRSDSSGLVHLVVKLPKKWAAALVPGSPCVFRGMGMPHPVAYQVVSKFHHLARNYAARASTPVPAAAEETAVVVRDAGAIDIDGLGEAEAAEIAAISTDAFPQGSALFSWFTV